MRDPVKAYIAWAVSRKRYVLWGFWIPLVAICAFSAIVTKLAFGRCVW